MKRCPLCGKEYEQEDMCPECRVMLIDTATNTAVAKEPEKKSRMNREKKPIPKGYIMAAVLVVVIVLVIAAAVFMVSNTRAKKEAEQRMQAQAAAEVEQSTRLCMCRVWGIFWDMTQRRVSFPVSLSRARHRKSKKTMIRRLTRLRYSRETA